jgi:hypothetical protein
VRRLANAELALHALALGQAGVTDHQAGGPGDTVARRLDALATALDTTISRLAVSLATRQPPQPLPALRPLQTALRDPLRSQDADASLARITADLVDATDAIADILRDHLPVPTATRVRRRHPQ